MQKTAFGHYPHVTRSLLTALATLVFVCSHAAAAEVDRSFVPRFIWIEGSYYKKPKIAVQADGKILVGGEFSECNGTPVKKIVRLEKNGVIDESFRPADGIRRVDDFTFGHDGWIYVRGEFEFAGRTSRLDRINYDGLRDTNFHGQWMSSGFAVRQDGTITFSGGFSSYYGTTAYLAQLKPDGQIDPAFQPDTRPSDVLSLCGGGVYLLPGGKLLVAGLFPYVGPYSMSIQRLFPNGKPDLSFTASGVQIGSIAFGAQIQRNGQIVFTDSSWNGVKRLNANGSADTSFKQHANDGPKMTVLRFAVAPDYRIYAVSGLDAGGESPPRLDRLHRDGTLDESFQQGSGPSDWVPADWTFMEVAVEADGSVLAAGNFRKFDGVECSGLVRLKADLVNTIVAHRFAGGKLQLSCVGNAGLLVIEGTEDLKSWNEAARAEFQSNKADVSLDVVGASRFFRIR
jgi:uncharacterized delta-60 repeat protein